jgi:hypothetical protein
MFRVEATAWACQFRHGIAKIFFLRLTEVDPFEPSLKGNEEDPAERMAD